MARVGAAAVEKLKLLTVEIHPPDYVISLITVFVSIAYSPSSGVVHAGTSLSAVPLGLASNLHLKQSRGQHLVRIYLRIDL